MCDTLFNKLEQEGAEAWLLVFLKNHNTKKKTFVFCRRVFGKKENKSTSSLHFKNKLKNKIKTFIRQVLLRYFLKTFGKHGNLMRKNLFHPFEFVWQH